MGTNVDGLSYDGVEFDSVWNTIEEFFGAATMRSPGILKPIEGELVLNAGPGKKMLRNTIPVGLPEWDADYNRLPFKDNTVDGIHTYFLLEYVQDPVKVIKEFQRVLKPGGLVNIAVPYYSCQLAYHDISYKNFFCETTWKYLFDNPYYDRADWEHYDKEKLWLFKVNFNIIIGVIERNMFMLTQLEKQEG